jgi:hypothetical protein
MGNKPRIIVILIDDYRTISLFEVFKSLSLYNDAQANDTWLHWYETQAKTQSRRRSCKLN